MSDPPASASCSVEGILFCSLLNLTCFRGLHHWVSQVCKSTCPRGYAPPASPMTPSPQTSRIRGRWELDLGSPQTCGVNGQSARQSRPEGAILPNYWAGLRHDDLVQRGGVLASENGSVMIGQGVLTPTLALHRPQIRSRRLLRTSQAMVSAAPGLRMGRDYTEGKGARKQRDKPQPRHWRTRLPRESFSSSPA